MDWLSYFGDHEQKKVDIVNMPIALKSNCLIKKLLIFQRFVELLTYMSMRLYILQ